MNKNTNINKTKELQNLMKQKKKQYEVRCSNCKATVFTSDLPNWNKYGGFCHICIGKVEKKIRSEILLEDKKQKRIKRQKELEEQKQINKRKKAEYFPNDSREKVVLSLTDVDFNRMKRGKIADYDMCSKRFRVIIRYESDEDGVFHGISKELRTICSNCNGNGYVEKES